jgi:hypothetical protein
VLALFDVISGAIDFAVRKSLRLGREFIMPQIGHIALRLIGHASAALDF